METIEALISKHPFFEGMAPAQLATLTGCATLRSKHTGEFVFRTGEAADHFYLVRGGRVAVETYAPERGELVILTLTEGDVLGWSWLIPPYRWHFDARALEDALLIAFDGRCLREKFETDHHLGYEVMKRFATVITLRLEATRMQLLDVYATRT